MTTEERLDRLERENSRLKQWGGLSLCVVAGLALMGQAAPPPKVIQAQRFEIVDKDGEQRALLGYSRMGSDLALEMRDTKGVPRVLLLVPDDGAPYLFLKDATSRIRVGLGLDSFESPELVLAGKNAQEVARVCQLQDGSPRLALSDADGCARAVLGTDYFTSGGSQHATPPSSLRLLDKDGKVLFRAPQ